jgi:hypothetical protein
MTKKGAKELIHMSDFWFKPKTHGYGATPNTWQGWVATAVAALAPGVLGWFLLRGSHIGANANMLISPAFVIWLTATIAIVISFHRLARRKTDGEWRWRWREPPNLDPNNRG